MPEVIQVVHENERVSDDRIMAFQRRIMDALNGLIHQDECAEGLSRAERSAIVKAMVIELGQWWSYPATSQEVTIDTMRFKIGVIPALRAFKERTAGNDISTDERFAAMQDLIAELARIYEIPVPELVMENIDGSNSGSSNYDSEAHRITMQGRLSIITLLHEFAHARGMNEYQAVSWSVSLFKRVYPQAYARLNHVGHTLVEDIPGGQQPAPQGSSTPRVVVMIDGGRCIDICSDINIEARVIDADTEGQDEEDLVCFNAAGGEWFYPYSSLRSITASDSNFINSVFQAIEEKEA